MGEFFKPQKNILILDGHPQEFNDYIKPVCLLEPGDVVEPGDLVTCMGWGQQGDSAGGLAPELRMVQDLPAISNQLVL